MTDGTQLIQMACRRRGLLNAVEFATANSFDWSASKTSWFRTASEGGQSE